MSMHAETNIETVVYTLRLPCADSRCSAGSIISAIYKSVYGGLTRLQLNSEEQFFVFQYAANTFD